MKIFNHIGLLQEFSHQSRADGLRIGLVPTMGYLHPGHLSLIKEAKRRCDVVIVSIFVNPTQFGPNEDLDSYPRDFARDCKLCEEAAVDAVFAPESAEMYFPDASISVEEKVLSKGLCGGSRPGHFAGVCTVVAKLFNAALPDIAVFGQKDAQQALIIRRMVRDLNFPVEIIVAPIVREADGLAMSSRNRYLLPQERKNALVLSRTVKRIAHALDSGNRDFAALVAGGITDIADSGGKLDYLEILDADSLDVPNVESANLLVAVAAKFGTTRLIDNAMAGMKNENNIL